MFQLACRWYYALYQCDFTFKKFRIVHSNKEWQLNGDALFSLAGKKNHLGISNGHKIK